MYVHCMTSTKIDGMVISKVVKDEVMQEVVEMKEAQQSTIPCLATVLVGDEPASATYVKNKHRACKEVGITTVDHHLAKDITQQELEEIIKALNVNEKIHGILVQLPLPKHLDVSKVTSCITFSKDVDGLTPHNAGLLSTGKNEGLVPCTPLGIMRMFDYHDIKLPGKNAIIINRSNLVGKPLFHLLLARDVTVIMCHSKTPNIPDMCKKADIIITAVGDRDRFILTADMIKEDAIIIDVAITRHNGKLAGDVDYDNIIKKASFVTPVPGGVGPMTVAMLLKNTVTAAKMQQRVNK